MTHELLNLSFSATFLIIFKILAALAAAQALLSLVKEALNSPTALSLLPLVKIILICGVFILCIGVFDRYL